MNVEVKKFFQRWVIDTLAVLLASHLVSGIHHLSPFSLFGASLLLGILNAVVKPFMVGLALPLVFLTLGFFYLVINALLLLLVSALLKPYFIVDGFWPALWGGVVISLTSLILNSLTGTGNARVKVKRGGNVPPRRPPPPDDGGGPIIDV